MMTKYHYLLKTIKVHSHLIIIIIISHTPSVFVFNDKSASEQYNNLPQVIN